MRFCREGGERLPPPPVSSRLTTRRLLRSLNRRCPLPLLLSLMGYEPERGGGCVHHVKGGGGLYYESCACQTSSTADWVPRDSLRSGTDVDSLFPSFLCVGAATNKAIFFSPLLSAVHSLVSRSALPTSSVILAGAPCGSPIWNLP